LEFLSKEELLWREYLKGNQYLTEFISSIN
jgi:hypothetical protein